MWIQLIRLCLVRYSLLYFLKKKNTVYFFENNKKLFFGYHLLLKLLFICLFALFMSHEQYKRCQLKKKKKNVKLGRKKCGCADQTNTMQQFLFSGKIKKQLTFFFLENTTKKNFIKFQSNTIYNQDHQRGWYYGKFFSKIPIISNQV